MTTKFKTRLRLALALMLAFLSSMLCVTQSVGQTTSVSFTITDGDSQTWNNGTWTAQLTPPSGLNTNNFVILGTSTPVPNQSQSGSLNSGGSGSLTVTPNTSIAPSNTQWTFVFCPQATPTQCPQFSFTITGTSQVLTPTVPGARVSLQTPNIRALAYLDLEITGAQLGSFYFNLNDSTLHVCIVYSAGACTTWQAIVPYNANPTFNSLIVGASGTQWEFSSVGQFFPIQEAALNIGLPAQLPYDINVAGEFRAGSGDNSTTIQLSGGATSKTISFLNTTYTEPPICTITPTSNLASVSYWISSTTNTQITVNISSAVGVIFNMVCFPPHV